MNELRNCEGKFPKSTWGTQGHRLGPLKIRQCPKNLIHKSTLLKIENYDLSRAGIAPVAVSMDQVSNYYFDLMKLIENERYTIRRDKENVLASRKK